MEDERIIDLYWAREEKAIRHTEQKYGAYCRKIAWNILADREDCEECLNDTWLKAWNAMPDERPQILSAFLGAITRNLSLDRYRKKHAEKRGSGTVTYIFDEFMDGADEKEPVIHMEEKELVDALNRFLKGLSKEQRVVFVRRYWYMDSIAEIAKRCACSENRIKSMLFRERSRLKEYLRKEGFEV